MTEEAKQLNQDSYVRNIAIHIITNYIRHYQTNWIDFYNRFNARHCYLSGVMYYAHLETD